MGNPYNDDPLSEHEEADNRIQDIIKGSRQEARSAPADDLDDVDRAVAARAGSRSGRMGGRAEVTPPPRATVRPGGAGKRSTQAIVFIGLMVGAGVLIVLVLLLVSGVLGGGNLLGGLFATATPTATATPVATDTPIPTETPIPTITPPALSLPPLTCIFQSGTGCFDYCQQVANQSECNSARDFVRAQKADPDVWFNCLSPGPGPNQGNPQECLRQAWHAVNQP